MPDIRFYTHTCSYQGCAAIFSIPDELDTRFRRTHESFCCPFGHFQSYTAKTNEEQMKEKIAQREKEKKDLEGTISAKEALILEQTEKLKTCELSINAYKGVIGKQKKQIEELKK